MQKMTKFSGQSDIKNLKTFIHSLIKKNCERTPPSPSDTDKFSAPQGSCDRKEKKKKKSNEIPIKIDN